MSAAAIPLPERPAASALRWRDTRFWPLLLLSILLHTMLIVVVKKDPLESGEAASKLAGPLNVRIAPKVKSVEPEITPPPAPPKVVPRLLTAPRRNPDRPAIPEPPPDPTPPAPPVVAPPAPPMTFEQMVAGEKVPAFLK